MIDIGTVNNYIQIGLWVGAAIAYSRKMWKDRRIEPPFTSFRNRLIGYALIAGLLISSASLYYNLKPRTVVQTVYIPQPTPARIIMGWGDVSGKNCSVSVDPTGLLKYRDAYEVGVICGFTDPAIDKFEDQNVTITPLYTIGLQPFDIATPWSKPMAAALEKAAQEAKRLSHNPCAAGAIPTWFEVVVLPKGTNIADIHKLSDVPRFGGIILSQQQNRPPTA